MDSTRDAVAGGLTKSSDEIEYKENEMSLSGGRRQNLIIMEISFWAVFVVAGAFAKRRDSSAARLLRWRIQSVLTVRQSPFISPYDFSKEVLALLIIYLHR